MSLRTFSSTLASRQACYVVASKPTRTTQRINGCPRSSERKCRQVGHRHPKRQSADASTYSGQQEAFCPCERRTDTSGSRCLTLTTPAGTPSLACLTGWIVEPWSANLPVLCACVAGVPPKSLPDERDVRLASRQPVVLRKKIRPPCNMILSSGSLAVGSSTGAAPRSPARPCAAQPVGRQMGTATPPHADTS